MRKNMLKNAVLFASCLLLSACGFFDKDNTPNPTPLTDFTPEAHAKLVWSTSAGNGAGDEYLKMQPTLKNGTLYTAGSKGTVTAIDAATGRINWKVGTQVPLSAGPGVGENLIVVGSRKGDVVALNTSDGGIIWKQNVNGEILAKPAVGENLVIIKTMDGYIRALSLTDGHERWSFQQVEPNLILRGSSSPLIRHRSVIAGFANGNLAKFSAADGQIQWMQPLATPEGAFAIQRMIDIDPDPVVYNGSIYAATYQGKIASLDWESGRIIWDHNISSYTGMAVAPEAIYITDAKSDVWGFNRDSGLVNWRQTKLEARGTSGPAVMDNYLVVGDAQGYVHWLSQSDGHFVARQKAGAAIYAAPIVAGNTVYVATTTGRVLAYTLTR